MYICIALLPLMPKKILYLLFFYLAATSCETVIAQQSLPDFSVKDIGKDRYVISWVNHYPVTTQITIQRSFDSTRGFKSILTVPDPTTKQNGYADTKAINDHMYYRLYILLQNGEYLFTAAKQPIKDSVIVFIENKQVQPQTQVVPQPQAQPIAKETLLVKETPPVKEERANRTVAPPSTIPETKVNSTKEKLLDTITATTPVIAPIIEVKRIEPVVYRITPTKAGDSAKIPTAVTTKEEPNAFAPSLFVYAHPDGNIRIQVPNRARLARYRIKFFEADKRFLFELKNLPAPNFQLDKTNFLHAGWFLFELYEDNRLIEKHKVYLEKS